MGPLGHLEHDLQRPFAEGGLDLRLELGVQVARRLRAVRLGWGGTRHDEMALGPVKYYRYARTGMLTMGQSTRPTVRAGVTWVIRAWTRVPRGRFVASHTSA